MPYSTEEEIRRHNKDYYQRNKEKIRLRNRVRYLSWKEKGLCRWCGKAAEGQTLCPKHRKLRSLEVLQRMTRFQARGLCTRCGKGKLQTEWLCFRCALSMAKYGKRRREKIKEKKLIRALISLLE